MNDKVRYRMCAGCRTIMHQSELIRVCKVNDNILIDKTNQSGGRGAYICSKSCLQKAEKTKQLNRILKSEVPAEIYTALYKEFNDANN